jgi:hypothetical protein
MLFYQQFSNERFLEMPCIQIMIPAKTFAPTKTNSRRTGTAILLLNECISVLAGPCQPWFVPENKRIFPTI